MTANINLAASLTATAAPPTPAARAGAGTGDGADIGFAQCLDQARDSEAPSEADTAEDAAREGPRTPAKARPPRSGTSADAARRNPPAQDATKPPAVTATGGGDVCVLETGSRCEPHDDAGEAAGIDLAALLPGWVAPAQPAPAAAAAQPTEDITRKAAGEPLPPLPMAPDERRAPEIGVSTGPAAALPALAATGEARPAPPERVQAQPADLSSANTPRAPHPPTTLDGPAQNAAVGSLRSLHNILRADHDGASLQTVFSLLPAQFLPPAAPASAAAAPMASAHVAAAVDSAAFAPSLATQVRWLVRDGVQQAELTLNPAEMGPVAVKIAVVDGREARIDFSADLAATRVALEASLPVLAAALDDSGLRLTGGGVHDGQARHQPAWSARAGTTPHDTAALQDDDGVAPLAAAMRALPQRGLIDLVA